MVALGCFLAITIAYFVVFFFLGRKDEQVSFLDKKHSAICKGIATVAVLFGHIGQFTGLNGVEYPAGVGVSIFLILSGFGIAYSLQKNGIKGFWGKRLLRVYLPYILVESAWMIIKQPSLSFWDVVFDLTLVKPLYQFGWYLRFIVVCYLFIWLVYALLKNEKARILVLFALFTVWFVIKSTVWIDSTPFLEARQAFAFPIGALLAIKKTDLKIKLPVYLLMIFFSTAIYLLLHIESLGLHNLPVIVYNVITLFTCVVCAIGVIGLVYKLKILQNKGMIHLSVIAYEVYIIHGYLINGLTNGNQIASTLIFLGVSIAASIVLHYLVDFLVKGAKKLLKKEEING